MKSNLVISWMKVLFGMQCETGTCVFFYGLLRAAFIDSICLPGERLFLVNNCHLGVSCFVCFDSLCLF